MPYATGSSYWVGSAKPKIPNDFEAEGQATEATIRLDKAMQAGRGGLLYGPTGTGKTTLLARFGLFWLRQPLPIVTRRTRAPWLDREAVWSTVAEYVDDVKSEISMSRRDDFSDFSESFSATGIARSTPLLFLDDLGSEADTEYNRATVEALIDARYRMRDERFTWFTTNLELSELAKRYSARTLSRLCEMSELIRYGGEDRRMAQAIARQAEEGSR